jgi:hypothetical protein
MVRFQPLNLLLFIFSAFVVACSSSPETMSKKSPEELCREGVARACAKEYRQLAAQGPTDKAEKVYEELCQMPRVACYQVRPDENFANESQLYEKLLEQDIWDSGKVKERRVVLYRTVDVSPDHLKKPEKKKSRKP